MPAATLTEKGQIIIPAEIRARYELTPGTEVEFVDEDGSIRLLIRRNFQGQFTNSKEASLPRRSMLERPGP